MNKTQAIELLAKTRYGGNTDDARKALDSVLDLMIRTVINGEKINWTGFGTLETEWVAPRFARNPQTGERVEVPSTIRIKWWAGQGFRDLANGDREIADYPAFINHKLAKGEKENDK